MFGSGPLYSYIINLPCNQTFNYTIQVYDGNPNIVVVENSSLRTYWGPVIVDTGIVQNSENSVLVWANITDWGSGVAEVVLEYEFESQGGQAARTQVETIPMEFNGSFYVIDLVFAESGSLSWTVIAKDASNTLITSESASQPFFLGIPAETMSLEDFLPIIIAVAIIPLVIAFTVTAVRRRYQRKASKKKQREMEIVKRFTDVLSIRSIICRNNYGMPFYTENFLTQAHDLDLTAGLTAAVSSLVTEVSQRAMKKGEFNLLEREGFSILSHHGENSTISLVSEGRLSDFMKGKISKLHDSLESKFTQQELEDPSLGDYPEEIRGMIYKYLNVGLLSKLTVNFTKFKDQEKSFSESERKQLGFLEEIPLRSDDGQISFYVPSFTSALTNNGIPLVRAYELLDKCFRLRIIYPISLEPRI